MSLAGLSARWRAFWRPLRARMAPNDRQRLFALTVLIGGICGLAAVAFHAAVNAVTRLTLDRAMQAPGHLWALWAIAVPVLGALLAGALLQYVVPNARGSGVPQVKVAFAVAGGRLRLRDSLGKFLISALQIGTGSSLGVEGPTVQIGSGIASTCGRLMGVAAPNLRRLLPVGAAAGIAAAFNAPMAAVTFTVEEIVGNLDQTLLSGVIVAAALAAVVERSVLGSNPVFDVPQHYGTQAASSLVLFAVLGLIAAGLSIVFTDALLRLRLWFRGLRRIPQWMQPAIGGLVTAVLAIIGFGLLKSSGITGGGYSTLDDALWGRVPIRILVPLAAMKLLSTVFSYSSGGAGGIFAPSLFVGGMAGGAVGALDMALFHHSPDSMGAFALVGMGAVFAGVIRAPITSVLIIIEMTNGYSLILPLMIANMIAYALARHLRPTPIYEALIQQDGLDLRPPQPPDIRHPALLVGQVAFERHPVSTLSRGVGAAELLGNLNGRQEVFPVLDEGKLVGIITLEDLALFAADSELLAGLVNAADLMRPPVALEEQDDLHCALETMLSEGLRELPVVDASGKLVGLLDETSIAHAYVRSRRRTSMDEPPPRLEVATTTVTKSNDSRSDGFIR
jgi:CIC family chloride channel protein